jgi:uncharacterized phiE125 gp8 family phage protein
VTSWALSLITAPTTDPVSESEAYGHARIVSPTVAEIVDIQTKLAAAVQDRERFTMRQFVTATWELWLDAFPCSGVIAIPKPPLASVTSVKYIDQDGAEQTFSSGDYLVVAPAGPACQHGFVSLGYGKSWPSTRPQKAAVKVRFVAGYGAATAVPSALKQAVLLVFGDSYANREDQPYDSSALRAADRLCWPYRSFVSMPEEY